MKKYLKAFTIPHTSISQEASIGYPTVPVSNHYAKSVQIFPAECRQRAATYRGKLSLTVKWMVDGSPAGSSVRFPGQVPIMVKVCIKIIMVVIVIACL